MNPAPQSSPTRFGSPHAPASRVSSRSKTAKLAGALLGLFAAATPSFAVTDWTGAVSQDWATAGNWTNGVPVENGTQGQVNISTATGNFPKITAAGNYAADWDIVIGSAAAGRLDQSAGTLASGDGNWFFLGWQGRQATYNLADTSATGGAFTGFGPGAGSLSVGGLAPSGDRNLFVGLDNSTVSVFNIHTTGTVSAGGLFVASNGATSSGTVNLDGGTVNVANEAQIGASFWGNGGTANLNISGGTFTANIVSFGRGNNASAVIKGNGNITGGTLAARQYLTLGFAGSVTNVSTVTNGGGTVNVNTSGGGNMEVGVWDPSINTFNQNSGALNLQNNASIIYGVLGHNGQSTINHNGGAVTFYGDAGTTIGGTGALTIGGGTSSGTYAYNLNGGTLTVPKIQRTSAAASSTFNFNGGTLVPTASDATFLRGLTNAYVKAGGAIVNTNGFDITIGQALRADTVSTGGGLTKLGAGTLTLSGLNTYVGDTAINVGGVTLADDATLKFVVGAAGVNTRVTGAGSFTVDGDFTIDVAGAASTAGTTWQLVDNSALTESYGTTFSVTGFTAASGKWVKPANGVFYEFDPATGLLRATSEDPGISYPPPTATIGNYNTSYVVGSDVVLSVSANGLGSLTYQWYLDGSPISGATAATLTISAAAAATNSVYSVVITDHAAEASGQPATTVTKTFDPISVLPASSFAVAYYRFEEGANGDPVASATDSVGTNHLTALGAPIYTSASVPYTTIPATGTSNTLGANFPGSGNNGLVAPTDGTLATTAFTDFTVEAFVRLSSLGGWQTLIGRDDVAPGAGAGDQSLFYLSKAGAAVGSGANNAFRIELVSKDNTNLQVNSSFVPTVGTWYHVAAVGNSLTGTLKLYVNGNEVGSTTGFTGLMVPPASSDTPWTVGRGDYAYGDVDYLRGDIDEVRFTRTALPPSQFLNTANGVVVVTPSVSLAPAAQTIAVGSSATLTATATSNMGGSLTYQWLKDGSPLSGQTAATLTVNATATTSTGSYGVIVTDSNSTAAGFPITATAASVVRVLEAPAPGARAIGLNFVGASSGGSFSTEIGPIASGLSAGFFPATNWNNSATATYVAVQTSPLALAERNGSAASGATATWNSANTWALRPNTGLVEAKTPDALLLHGYIESRAATGATVTVSNIPYGSYDVYVYVSGGNNGGANVGSISLNRAGSPTYYYRALQHDSYAPAVLPTVGNPYAITPMIGDAVDRAGAVAAPPATFIRFTGVTGGDLTISAIDQTTGANAGGIAAIQIVDTTPPGAAYPPIVATPVSQLVKGGTDVTFTAAAQSQNSGAISYQWKKNDVDLSGQTSATLSLADVTGADSANYSVVVTDLSSAGTTTATRSASLVVVDGTRPVLINGDLNTATSATFATNGVLLETDQQTPGAFAQNASTWNGLTGAAGSGTLALSRESTGLSLPGLTFAYADAAGAEDDILKDLISESVSFGLMRDYLYTDSQTTTLKARIGGLQAFAGHRFTLLVYAFGKDTAAQLEAATEDAATVSLDGANNHLSQASQLTKPYLTGFTFDSAARRVEVNNPVNTSGAASAYVAFTGVVAADGTVAWELGADADLGRIALNGFQLLLTAENLAPAAPTNLAAVAGDAQVSLSWTASSGATSYTIRRGTAPGVYTTINAGAVLGTTFTDTGLTNGTTYYYVVAAANGIITSSGSNEVVATPNSSLTALQSWRQDNFGTTANTGNAANTADPDGDGQVNFLEYALGTDPNAAGVLPVTVARSGNFLALSFSHADDSTLVYTIEASDDLANWNVVHTYPAFTADGTETYTDTVSLTGQARRFLRLGVTAP